MSPRTTDLVMPKLGLTMTEGLLVEWHVGVGDEVRTGDLMFVVETDKVSNEIEAPGDGVIDIILVEAGETVATGTPLARWSGPGLPDMDDDSAAANAPPPVPAQRSDEPAADAQAVAAGQRIVATPFARKLARQTDVDLTHVTGSGPSGRIKAEDVARAGTPSPESASTARASGAHRTLTPSSIRLAMAARMTEAVREVPHFYLTCDVVVDPLLDLRRGLNIERAPLRFTLGHFVVAAIAAALSAEPDDNRIWNDGLYCVLDSVDVGVAIALDTGLVAPLLRGAGAMGLSELAAAHDQLVARARSGELTLDDMNGGAVTVSNLGAYGVNQVFPIINPPQSLIVGVGTARANLVQDEHGEIVRQMLLPLVLGADHRVFDGANAAHVLTRISEALQQPQRLLES